MVNKWLIHLNKIRKKLREKEPSTQRVMKTILGGPQKNDY